MRILIVDDSLSQINLLSEILRQMGHEVVGTAQTGTAGVRQCEETRPDVVFLDIVMPEMDGLSALRLIRKTDPEARVVMLTSKAGVGGDVSEALQLGALGVLAKPASHEEVSKILDRLSGLPGRS